MKSEQVNELAKALAIAQGEMGGAAMDKANPFLKSKYADLGSVIEAAKKPLAQNGLSIVQLVSNTDNGVSVETILMHASGQWVSSEMSLPVGDSKGTSLAQQYGGLITYLRRYSYSAIVGIYADEDTDGNGGNGNAKPQPQQAAQVAPKPADKKNELKAALKAARDECTKRKIEPPALTVERVNAMTESELEAEIANTKSLIK